jgi:hypothetical protein
VSTSRLKIKNPAYSQIEGRRELFQARSSRARRTVLVRHAPVLRSRLAELNGVIRSSTWAFTFSTPASANTAGVVSEGVAARLASSSTATLLTGANVSATRHAKMRREKLSITARETGARPVEQTDDGGVDVPHLVGSSRRSPIFGFTGCTRSRGRRQPCCGRGGT